MSTARITNSTQTGKSLKEVVSHCVRNVYSTDCGGICHETSLLTAEDTEVHRGFLIE